MKSEVASSQEASRDRPVLTACSELQLIVTERKVRQVEGLVLGVWNTRTVLLTIVCSAIKH